MYGCTENSVKQRAIIWSTPFGISIAQLKTKDIKQYYLSNILAAMFDTLKLVSFALLQLIWNTGMVEIFYGL